jgi:hypothetical protein
VSKGSLMSLLLTGAGLLLLFGFAAGYGLREVISRRRRAVARRRYYERQHQKAVATRNLLLSKRLSGLVSRGRADRGPGAHRTPRFFLLAASRYFLSLQLAKVRRTPTKRAGSAGPRDECQSDRSGKAQGQSREQALLVIYQGQSNCRTLQSDREG